MSADAGELSDAEKIAHSRRAMAALSARDFSGYLAAFTDDYVFRVDRSLSDSDDDLVVARKQLVRFLDDLLASWDQVRYDFDPDAEVINDRVFSNDRWHGRRRHGDPETSVEFYAVASFRGDRVYEVIIFAERDDALSYARRG